MLFELFDKRQLLSNLLVHVMILSSLFLDLLKSFFLFLEVKVKYSNNFFHIPLPPRGVKLQTIIINKFK